MTDSEKELVARLDEHWGRRRVGDMSCLLADAADALEAAWRERDEARAEVRRLKRELDLAQDHITDVEDALEAKHD